jgi:putative ABC transport system permease protein
MALFRQIEIPTDLPIALTFELDRRALLFSLMVAIGSALLFGLVPAIQATRTDLTAIMKAADSVAPRRRGRRWGRSVLVAAQVAISVVLLAVAMFMYRGFGAQLAEGPGYRTDHLLMMRFDTTLVRYTEGQAQQFFERVAERARAVPGVKSVTLSTSVPMLNDSNDAVTVVPEGFQFAPGRESATVMAASVDEYYFDTMALTLLEGRNFRTEDSAGAPRVAIVNQQFAQHYWPNQDPINKRFRLVGADAAWVQVVGLAKTSKYIFIAEPPSEFVYLPYRQQRPQRMTMLAQSAGDPSTLTGPMREIVHGLDSNLPISGVRTMEALYEMRATRIFRVLITVIGGMGLMGLGLAIVGLYGLVAFAVGRRTREIGIRMAVGADRTAVVQMVLRQGLVLALVGLAVGVAASVGAGQLLQAAFPTGEDQGDIVALLLVVPIVLAVTFLAAYVPARQASRVDPILALRHE